ncbi:MAG: hypothetical protein GOVbin4551_6 [Prokaryotic dsDNA virus sp.]|nr:MAG: hypothetical protein GOVbin4551_6 [Prokaryotic dsDNA virus sp.]
MSQPNKEEKPLIRNLVRQQNFQVLMNYLERTLQEIRKLNDNLPIEEIQIGQGRAKSINNLIEILKDLAK